MQCSQQNKLNQTNN